MQKILQNGVKTTELQQFANKGLTNAQPCAIINLTKGKEIKTMARLRLEKINGQWYLINKVSGKILAETTEETQKALRHIALTSGSQFTLEVV